MQYCEYKEFIYGSVFKMYNNMMLCTLADSFRILYYENGGNKFFRNFYNNLT
jgi:hypothetical protein